MKWTTEAKVGAFTIVGIVLFVLGIILVQFRILKSHHLGLW